MHGISQRHSSRSWMLSWALLALLSFAAGRAHAQQYTAPVSGVAYAYPGGYQVNAYGQPYRYVQPYSYTAPYTYAPTYAYGRPYAGSYSYPAAVPSASWPSSVADCGPGPVNQGDIATRRFVWGSLPGAAPWTTCPTSAA